VTPHVMVSPTGDYRAVTTQAQHLALTALGWSEYTGIQGE
jgi:hypothetical protein